MLIPKVKTVKDNGLHVMEPLEVLVLGTEIVGSGTVGILPGTKYPVVTSTINLTK